MIGQYYMYGSYFWQYYNNCPISEEPQRWTITDIVFILLLGLFSEYCINYNLVKCP